MWNRNITPNGVVMNTPVLQKFRDVNMVQDANGMFVPQVDPVILNNMQGQYARQDIVPPQMAGGQVVPQQSAPQYQVDDTIGLGGMYDDFYSRMHGYNLAQKQGDTYGEQAKQIGALPTRGFGQGFIQGLLQNYYYDKSRNAYDQNWNRVSNVQNLQNQNKLLMKDRQQKDKEINLRQKEVEKLKSKRAEPKLLDRGSVAMGKKLQKIQPQTQQQTLVRPTPPVKFDGKL